MTRSSKVLDYVSTHAWALQQDVYANLLAVLRRHLSGVKLPQEEIDAIVEARNNERDRRAGREDLGYQVQDGVAVVQLGGIIAKHADQVNGSSQPRGTATSTLHKRLGRALEDDGVGAILLDIDSPGGSVEGVDGVADAVRAAGKEKPLWAYVEDTMASAAFWIGAQANRVHASRGALVGSIGVVSHVLDDSRLLKNEGLDEHVITSGEHKAGVDRVSGAFGERQKADVQSMVDRYADLFVAAVARGRGMGEDVIRQFATGEVWLGQDAIEIGLVDQIATFGETMAALRRKAGLSGESRATPSAGGAGVFAASGEAPAVACEGGEIPMDENDKKPEPEATGTGGGDAGKMPNSTHNLTEAELEATRREAREEERKRAADIKRIALRGQEDLASKLIDDGVTVEAARAAFLEDMRSQQSSKPVGEAEATVPTSAKESTKAEPVKGAVERALSATQMQAKAAAEFADNEQELAAEFGTLQNYTESRMFDWAQANGRMSVAAGKEE